MRAAGTQKDRRARAGFADLIGVMVAWISREIAEIVKPQAYFHLLREITRPLSNSLLAEIIDTQRYLRKNPFLVLIRKEIHVHAKQL
jgi:hypothetical protein